jgi:hypothetical protein
MNTVHVHEPVVGKVLQNNILVMIDHLKLSFCQTIKPLDIRMNQCCHLIALQLTFRSNNLALSIKCTILRAISRFIGF